MKAKIYYKMALIGSAFVYFVGQLIICDYR